MPKNIEKITLEKNPNGWNDLRLVKVHFKMPCEWTVLNIDDLKEILRLWIIGEEEHYPPSKGCRGRWMLFDEIKKVFEKTEVKKDEH